jgi:hypothetical protein
MNHIVAYIDRYGHQSFEERPFNEVDALIFSELSYLNFHQLVHFSLGLGGCTLASIAIELIKKNTFKFSGIMDTSYRKLPKLIKRLYLTRRYGSLWLSGYVNFVVEEEAQQFSAITISMNEYDHFVAIRGTDSTFSGWKEDTALSFQKRIPSHYHVRRYLTQVAQSLPGKIRIGGHSKGGHLAIHAISFSQAIIRHRIIEVFSFDAPGLHRDDIVEKGYLASIPKIKSYIPQESVIGLFLEPQLDTVIIQSSQIGFMQHDAFSWKIEADHFKCIERMTDEALDFQKDIQAWVSNLEDYQRKDFFDLMFQIFSTSKAKNLRELSLQFPFSVIHILRGYSRLSSQNKQKLKKPIQMFFKGGNLFRKLSLLAHLYPRIIKDK